MLWDRTVYPRIRQFVPTGTILEIGPGFGRWTHYLRGLCDHLILVDLSERCIESCRARFAGDSHIEYIVNDGTSLDQVPDGSVDFIFSFDSLVHAESDAVAAYVAQAARKLKPGGGGFIHHSNLAAFRDGRREGLPWFITRPHWRGVSMSADVFRGQCSGAGLSCQSQELINWLGRERDADRHHLDGRCLPLIDCLSTFVNTPGLPSKRIPNYGFVEEWRQAVWMAGVYYHDANDGAPAATVAAAAPAAAPVPSSPLRRKWLTGRSIVRRQGWAAAAGLAFARAAAIVEHAASAAWAHVTGEANRWFLRRRILRPH